MTDNGRMHPNRADAALDLAKLAMALLVVGIHTEPFAFNLWLDRGFGMVTRLCVPFFYVATSYLYWRREPAKPAGKYLLRMFVLYAVWVLIYLPLDIRKMPRWPLSMYVDTFLLSGYRHLWFLSSSIFGFLIVYLLSKRLSARAILIVSTAFLFFGCCESTWTPLTGRFLRLGVSEYISRRNPVFYAFPYMAMGKYIAAQKPDARAGRMGLGLGLSALLLAAESYVFVVKLRTEATLLWFSVFPMTYCFFRLLLSCSARIDRTAARRCRNVSTLVYCVHPYFIRWLYPYFGNAALFGVVSALSIAAAYLIVRLSERRGFGALKYLY